MLAMDRRQSWKKDSLHDEIDIECVLTEAV
jgi:hypothetical protein